VINELGIYYQPDLAKGRAKACRRQLTVNLAVFAFIVGLGVAAILFDQFDPGSGQSDWGYLLASSFPIPATIILIMTVFTLVAYLRAAKTANSAEGLAIGLNRDGILIHGQWLPWPEVGDLKVLPSRWGGSTQLRVSSRDGAQLSLPLIYTDTMPAELDIAVRTLSSGRARVDLSRLDG
jgi:hypothetical protein